MSIQIIFQLLGNKVVFYSSKTKKSKCGAHVGSAPGSNYFASLNEHLLRS